MSERELEREETKVARTVRTGTAAPVERIAPPAGDLRFHTGAAGLTVARAPAAGDRQLADGLAHAVRERGAPRAVSRDFIDDIKSWWSGETGETKEMKRVERKEVAVTKQDFDQVIMLVTVPLANAQAQLSGEADVAKAKAALDKVSTAAQSMMVIANTKKEASNRDVLYVPVNTMNMATATLEVMSEPDKAQEVWQNHFKKAMERVDEVLALPIRDENAQPDPAQPAPDPDATLTQRDHDLIQVGLKAHLQSLIETTAGVPYQSWDPKTVAGDSSASAAAGAFSNRKLLTVRARIDAGQQAIKTFAMSLNEQQAEASGLIDQALGDCATALGSFTGDPADPNTPSDAPPEEQPQ
jgi:hypothetical protein